MKVQKWLTLGEACPKGHVIPKLKRGSKTPVSRDKAIRSLKTPYQATQVHQVVHGAKGVKYRISTIKRGDKE